MVSDGVSDNIGDAFVTALVSKAYSNSWPPQALADQIVADSIATAYSPGGKPDDTTVVVAYLRPAQS